MGKLNNIIKNIKNALNPYEDEVRGNEYQADRMKSANEDQTIRLETEDIDVSQPLTTKELNNASVNESQEQDNTQEVPAPQDEPTVSPQSKIAPPKRIGDNVIDTREKLVIMIVDVLKPSCGISQNTTINMTFFVADPLIELAMNEDFEDALRAKLEDNGLTAFANGKFKIVNGIAPQEGTIQVFEGVQILLDKGVTPSGQHRASLGDAIAVVAIVGDMGSLQDSQYELDSSKKAVFHIGRGQVVKRSGVYRINDVVINKDEKDSNLAVINQCVSSEQADIVWKNGAFYLRAMPSGCRPEGGSATKIIRDSKSIELRNSKLDEQLFDNDMIEFGGVLLLSFHLKQ